VQALYIAGATEDGATGLVTVPVLLEIDGILRITRLAAGGFAEFL
jgi:hypothetical protein